MKAFAMKGYENQGEGKPIPDRPTYVSQFVLVGKAAWLELCDAAMGRAGVAGYALAAMLAIVLGLVGFSVYFFVVLLRSSPDEAKVKKS